MTFAAPLFLIAALAGAIPIVLHMVNRQKAKDLPFATLRFLRISVQKTRRRKRVHDVLLMVLRAGVLLLIALGLAKPALTRLNSLWGGAQSAVAIVLDNSASMGMIDQGRMRFETATAAAVQILDELQDGDQAALLPTCGPVFAEQDRLDRTQDKIRQMLAQCRVSYERADLAVKVSQARTLLAKASATNKQIYVVTDMQANCWEGLKENSLSLRERAGVRGSENEGDSRDPKSSQAIGGPPHPSPLPVGEGTEIPIILVDCNRAPKPNVAVQGTALRTSVPVAGVPVKATVELLNTSSVPQQRIVELYVDGAKEASSPELSVAPDGRPTHDFVFTFRRGGLHRGEVRLSGEDGSKLDDRRVFAMEVDQNIPVAIVKAARHEIPYLEDSFYLEQALAPAKAEGWALRTSTLAAADLGSEPLDGYKIVFCVNLPAPEAAVAERLRGYLERGGSLVWICGDNVQPEAYNLMNQQAGGALLPGTLLDVRAPTPQDGRDAWSLRQLDKQHPALNQFVEPPSLYQSVLVYKHARIDPGTSGQSRVLARLDDGEPLLVEKTVGQGKVLFLGTGVHLGWTNLPLRPIFLPLLARLSFHLAGAEQARHEVLAGAPLVVRLEQQSQPVGIEVLPPTGETIRLTTQQEPGTPGQVFRYSDTHEPGIYLLRLLDTAKPTQFAYAVNPDPEEANPAKIDRAELQERLGRTPLIFADDPDDLSSTFKSLREGRSLWGLFLTGVLVALVFECFLSNRLSPKPPEEQAARK